MIGPNEEGKAAFYAGLSTKECPYTIHPMKDEWLQGWWKAFYAQRQADEQKIAEWLDFNHDPKAPILPLSDIEECLVVAKLIVSHYSYNRTLSIPMRFGTLVFTIPAPATLK